MKSRSLLAICTVCFLAVSAVAAAQTMQQENQPTIQPATEKSAGPHAPFDHDSSYGGTHASTSSAARAHHQATCSAAPNCDIYFGR